MTLLDNLKAYSIILASASPRRQYLLHEMGIHFHVVSTETDETYDKSLPAKDVAVFLSKKKAGFFNQTTLNDNEIIITADTLVSLDGEIIPKPYSIIEAEEFLCKLSGKMHFVYTGITLLSKHSCRSFCSESKVFFRKLDIEEIRYYLSEFSPLDKAGAYGIQEWIGYIGIERIEGSFYNVMGLPTTLLYKELSEFIK